MEYRGIGAVLANLSSLVMIVFWICMIVEMKFLIAVLTIFVTSVISGVLYKLVERIHIDPEKIVIASMVVVPIASVMSFVSFYHFF